MYGKLGEGNEVRFWKDIWVEGSQLKEGFSKLFHLSVQKNVVVSNMGHWENDVWKWNFRWRRELIKWKSGCIG